ncbi:DUF6228 family protein [Streptomyces sp. NPDC086023]|uniref:DUF6228 family protein n=1 Tax=Streptomyces sp. NPDC086023 TaxID=3365746 RepID=UPI0037D53FF1
MTSRVHGTDEHLDDDLSVAVRCRRDASARVRFGGPRAVDADCVHHSVELQAPGLTARVDDVVAWRREDGLAAFLDALAADYRGWDGARTWRTPDRDLAVSAVFGSGGHVGLTWTVRPWRHAAGDWSASVTVWLEAGEQMATLAADIRHLLAGRA